MTIADQINRLNNAKANIKQAIENKGVTVSDSALLDEYPALISSIPMEGGDPYYEEFYNLRTNNGTNMASMFARTSGELDLRRVDVSNVTNMKYMFDNSSASVNIDGWDTSNVTDMGFMFNYFTGSIDASKLDTSNVTNADYMFAYTNPDNIILTGLSFPKATSLANMFNSAKGTTLDLSSWDISNITNMSSMFAGNFTKIDLTGWKTTNVTNMSYIFYTYNNPLVELIIPDWDMTNYSGNIFYNSSYISKLMLIDLSRSNDATIIKIASYLPTRTATTFGTVLVPENTSQEAYDALIAKYWAPIGAAIGPVPTSIDIVAELDEIYPGKSTKVYLGSCEPWNADTSKVELVLVSDSSIATMTEDNEVISTGVVGGIVLEARIKDTQEVIGGPITISVSETDSYPNIIKFRIIGEPNNIYSYIITVNGTGKLLKNLAYDSIADVYSYDNSAPITSIKFDSNGNINELIKLNISNITNMFQMFQGCDNLTTLDLSNWDTSNVTNMAMMFYMCDKLTTLDVSNWDTSNVANTSMMFSNCSSLHTLRLDNCNYDTINKIITELPTNAISGVTRTIYCKESEAAGLTPPENWVFSYVTEEEPEVPVDPPAGDIPLYVPGDFRGNPEITEVVTMVNESHTDLSYMFESCTNLTSVNTQDWDVSNVTTVDSMFSNTYGMPVTSLDFSTWDTSNVTNMNSMFAYMQSSYLRKIDLSSFNTKKLEMAYGMFNWCNRLYELDIRNFELVHEDGTEAAIAGMLEGCDELYALRLDNCSNATISKIINESGIPTDTDTVTYYDYNRYEYITVTRTIYCKESEAAGLTAPTNWVFSYVD